MFRARDNQSYQTLTLRGTKYTFDWSLDTYDGYEDTLPLWLESESSDLDDAYQFDDKIFDIDALLSVAIDEQVLILYDRHSDIIDLKACKKYLAQKDSSLNKHIANHITKWTPSLLFELPQPIPFEDCTKYIASKVRRVFNQYHGNQKYNQQNLKYLISQIPLKLYNAATHFIHRRHLLRRVYCYKSAYNKYLKAHQTFINHFVQFGMTENGRYSFFAQMDYNSSILMQFSNNKARNQLIEKLPCFGYESQDSDEGDVELTTTNIESSPEQKDETYEKTYKHKTGLGGMFARWSIMKQLYTVCKFGIAFDSWRKIGACLTTLVPPHAHKYFPPLMSGGTIRVYIQAIRRWFCDQINERVLTDRWPVVNAAMDAGTFKGYNQQKVVPIQLSTFWEKYGITFRWMYITQPQNVTKERAEDLAYRLKQVATLHPALRSFNAVAVDNGSTEVRNIEILRSSWPLLLMIIDWSHLYHTILKVGIEETWGNMTTVWRSGSCTKSIISDMLKMTKKVFGCNANLIKGAIKHCNVGEFLLASAGSDCRFSGNIDASGAMLSRRLVQNPNDDDCALYDDGEIEEAAAPISMKQKSAIGSLSDVFDDDGDNDIEFDEEKSSEENDNSDAFCSLHRFEQTINFIGLLPELSGDEDVGFDAEYKEQRKRSNFKSSRAHPSLTIDAGIYDKVAHEKSWRDKKRKFDPSKITVVLREIKKFRSKLKKKTDAAIIPDIEKLIDWWSKRHWQAAIMTVHCLGSRLIQPLLEMNTRYKNRIIEQIPLIAKKFESICKIRRALRWLLNQYDRRVVVEAAKYIEEECSFDFRKKCALLYRKHRLFPWCKKRTPSNQYACDDHIRKYTDNRQPFVRLLPPRYSKDNYDFIKALFAGIIFIDDGNIFDAAEQRGILGEYLDDVFAFTRSEFFSCWNRVDGLDTLKAKVVIYVQCYRFVEWVHYKYIERIARNLEGGICLAPLLSHPEYSKIIACNVVSENIGKETMLRRTGYHLVSWDRYFKKSTHVSDRKYVRGHLNEHYSKGYLGGVAYLHDDIWSLIVRYSRSRGFDALDDDEFKLLRRWIDLNTGAMMDTYAVESFLKPIKDVKGQQKTGWNNLTNLFFIMENLQNCLILHPIHWFRRSLDKYYPLPVAKIPGAAASTCPAFPQLIQSTLRKYKLMILNAPKKYIRLWLDPSLARNEPIDLRATIGGFVHDDQDDNKNRDDDMNQDQHAFDDDNADNDDDDAFAQQRNISLLSSSMDVDGNDVEDGAFFESAPIRRYEDLSRQNQYNLQNVFNSDTRAKAVYNQLWSHDSYDGGLRLMCALMSIANEQCSDLVTDLSTKRDVSFSHCKSLKLGQCHVAYLPNSKYFVFIHKQMMDNEISVIFSKQREGTHIDLSDDQLLSLLSDLGRRYDIDAVKIKAYNLVDAEGPISAFKRMLFCCARLSAVINGLDPLRLRFCEDQIYAHTAEILLNSLFTTYPSSRISRSAITRRQTQNVSLEICKICRRHLLHQTNHQMLQCECCSAKMHKECVSNMSDDEEDLCPECVLNDGRLRVLEISNGPPFMIVVFQWLVSIDAVFTQCEFFDTHDDDDDDENIVDDQRDKSVPSIHRFFARAIQKNMNNSSVAKLIDAISKNDALSRFDVNSFVESEVAMDFSLSFINALNTNFVKKIFGGIMQKDSTCRGCGYVETNHDEFNHIVLPVDDESTSFEECWDEYFKFQGCVACPVCTKNQLTLNQKVAAFPQYLLVKMDRMSSSDNGRIRINLYRMNLQGIMYKLHSVLNFIPPRPCSNNAIGRFTTHIRRYEQWYYCEGSHIERIVDIDRVISPYVVIFCFERHS